MTKKDWYKNRILWRAKGYNLLPCEADNVIEQDVVLKRLYIENVASNDEMLLYVSGDQHWTFLTTEKIVSYHNSCLYQIKLDDIEHEIKIDINDFATEDLKRSADTLLLGEQKVPFRFPDTKTLFTFMNILKMFPLKKKYNPESYP